MLAARKSVLGLGKMIPISAALFGATLIAFASYRSAWFSMVLLLGTGFGFSQQLAAGDTILQTIVEETKRGRVMAFYAMAFQGVAPFGSLLAGALAARMAHPPLILGGVLCIAGAIQFARGSRHAPSCAAHLCPVRYSPPDSRGPRGPFSHFTGGSRGVAPQLDFDK